jgi:UTP--glucose-1-phosphate uridylyltransferase
MQKPLRKAVFPVGGLGTRFLPATKSMPKEMLTVVDKPLIQYAVEEARAAGIEEMIFVTGRGKSALEDHFDYAYELHDTLKSRGKTNDLKLVESLLLKPGSIAYTRQQEPRGLGHAVWCARHLIEGEPFAVLLADDLVQAKTPCLKQMV